MSIARARMRFEGTQTGTYIGPSGGDSTPMEIECWFDGPYQGIQDYRKLPLLTTVKVGYVEKRYIFVRGCLPKPVNVDCEKLKYRQVGSACGEVVYGDW